MPREHLLVEMEYIDRRHRLSPLAWAMAEAGGRPELAEATQVAYRELVQPFWPRIRARLHAEQAARRRTLAAAVPARCWPRCRARGSAGGRRSWRS